MHGTPPGSPATRTAVTLKASTLLWTILLGGLLAGLGAASFHAIATEPLIDQAITLEELRNVEVAAEEPVVSREGQKIGLFVGWGVLGITWAMLFAGVYSLGLSRGWLRSHRMVPLALAVIGFCAFALVPGIKYPANPPGVGSSASIDFRQQMFVASWVLGAAGALIAAVLAMRLSSSPVQRGAIGIAFYVVWSAALIVMLPPNPDPVTMPIALVSEFRVLSLLSLAIFWALLGAAFAWATGREMTAPRVGRIQRAPG